MDVVVFAGIRQRGQGLRLPGPLGGLGRGALLRFMHCDDLGVAGREYVPRRQGPVNGDPELPGGAFAADLGYRYRGAGEAGLAGQFFLGEPGFPAEGGQLAAQFASHGRDRFWVAHREAFP